MIKQVEQTGKQSESKLRRALAIVQWAIIVLVCFPSVWFIVQSRKERANIDAQRTNIRKETEAAIAELVKAKLDKAEFIRVAQKAKLQRKQIEQTIKHYREVADFFPHKSEFCVCDLSDHGRVNDTLRLSLPEGEHFLEITMSQMFPFQETEPKHQQFVFPLRGLAAYFVEIKMPNEEGGKYRDPREIFLEITSSDNDFKSIKKPLLDKRLPPPSGSSTGFFGQQQLFFPNQYDHLNKDARSVRVNRMKWSFNLPEKQKFELQFEMRLRSVGPSIISATDTFSIHKMKPKYIGKGRYQVVPADEKTE